MKAGRCGESGEEDVTWCCCAIRWSRRVSLGSCFRYDCVIFAVDVGCEVSERVECDVSIEEEATIGGRWKVVRSLVLGPVSVRVLAFSRRAGRLTLDSRKCRQVEVRAG